MHPSLEQLKSQRKEILRLADAHGAKNVRIFGPVVRGDANDDSSVDFLVKLESDRSLLDLGGLQMALQELLHCEVHIVTDNGIRGRIRLRVLREVMPL